jgi:hypothetical protein
MATAKIRLFPLDKTSNKDTKVLYKNLAKIHPQNLPKHVDSLSKLRLTSLNPFSSTVTDCKALINWSNLGIASNEVAQIPEESAAVYRTFIFAVVYLALYSALIFTALFSLCGINNSCLGRRSFPIFFAPWIFVCCSIVVMDILATTFYIMDSISTAVSLGDD